MITFTINLKYRTTLYKFLPETYSKVYKCIALTGKESIPFVLVDTGETIDVNIMTLLLSHSRHRIYKLSLKTNREMLMHLLTEAFTFYVFYI